MAVVQSQNQIGNSHHQNQNCTDLNKWHVISVTWSNEGENLSNCSSNGEKLISFTKGNVKGSDSCYIENLGKIPGWNKTHLTGCIGEIFGLYTTMKNQETFVHSQIFNEKVGNYQYNCLVLRTKDLQRRIEQPAVLCMGISQFSADLVLYY